MLDLLTTGRHPQKPSRRGKLILLTSGTTGTPKGAARTGGGVNKHEAILERVPWHTDTTVVVAAPMFHSGSSRNRCSLRRELEAPARG